MHATQAPAGTSAVGERGRSPSLGPMAAPREEARSVLDCARLVAAFSSGTCHAHFLRRSRLDLMLRCLVALAGRSRCIPGLRGCRRRRSKLRTTGDKSPQSKAETSFRSPRRFALLWHAAGDSRVCFCRVLLGGHFAGSHEVPTSLRWRGRTWEALAVRVGRSPAIWMPASGGMPGSPPCMRLFFH